MLLALNMLYDVKFFKLINSGGDQRLVMVWVLTKLYKIRETPQFDEDDRQFEVACLGGLKKGPDSSVQ